LSIATSPHDCASGSPQYSQQNVQSVVGVPMPLHCEPPPASQRQYIQLSWAASSSQVSMGGGSPLLSLGSPVLPEPPGQAGSAQGDMASSTQAELHTPSAWQHEGSMVQTHVSVSALPQPGSGEAWQQLPSGGGVLVTPADIVLVALSSEPVVVVAGSVSEPPIVGL